MLFKKRFAGMLIGLTLITGVGIGAASPAAAVGSPSCPSGWACMWGLGGYEAGSQGWARFEFGVWDLADLSFNNKASSTWNNGTTCNAVYYTNTGYSGYYYIDVRDIGKYNLDNYEGGFFNNELSSARFVC